MAKTRKSRSGFIAGLVIGMAIGAALALLLAPQPADGVAATATEPGTRRRTQGGIEGVAAQLRERYGDAVAQGRDAYTRAKDEVLTRYTKAKSGE